MLRDILVAVLCFLAIANLVERHDKYPRRVRVVLISVWIAVAVVFLADTVWHIHAWTLMASSALCLAYDFVAFTSPSMGQPESYSRMLKIGWAAAFVAAFSLAGVEMGVVPRSMIVYAALGVVGLSGVALVAMAHVGLRPKGRPRG